MPSLFDRVQLDVPLDEFFNELISVDNAVFRESDSKLSLGHLSLQEYLAAQAIVWAQRVEDWRRITQTRGGTTS